MRVRFRGTDMALNKASRKISGAAASATRKAKGKLGDLDGPSPNVRTNLVIADIALRTGSMLARRGIERGLLGAKYTPRKARNIIRGRSMTEALLGTAVAKIATRSVPGAILMGGGLLAKTLYDRRRGRKAEFDGERSIGEMAQDGADSES